MWHDTETLLTMNDSGNNPLMRLYIRIQIHIHLSRLHLACTGFLCTDSHLLDKHNPVENLFCPESTLSLTQPTVGRVETIHTLQILKQGRN